MNQEKLNKIIVSWKTKKITPEEAMRGVHKLNNVDFEGGGESG